VARLIVKNSLYEKLRDHPVTVYATGDDCYPNTISDALSLLSTFVKSKKDTTTDDAMVSYHKKADDIDANNQDEAIPDDLHVTVEGANYTINEDTNKDVEPHRDHVTFSATVMASVIAEATEEAINDQFIGASFGQLQDVDDVYEDDAPDLVCCAHILDHDDVYDDHGIDSPDFVIDANINAKSRNERI
jgi:hypothetical protein